MLFLLLQLQRDGGMAITDCNNIVKTASDFFGPSCAVNALIDKYNPIGDNSNKLCSLCTGVVPGGKCTPTDPYAGFEGAFRCLVEAGDVAFLKHTTVEEMVDSGFIPGVTVDQFELLCRDGTRQPVSQYRQCDWGDVPSHALVVSSATSKSDRRRLKKFFSKAVNLYASKQRRYNSSSGAGYDRQDDRYRPYQSSYTSTSTTTYSPFSNFDQAAFNDSQPYETFDLFESKRYGRRLNLMFQDTTRHLAPINDDKQNYQRYLGKALDQIYETRSCPGGMHESF